jgi:beta-lactamase class A
MSPLKNKAVYLIPLALVLGIFVGILIDSNFFNQSQVATDKNSSTSNAAYNDFSELHQGDYKLINPLYECNTGLPFGNVRLLDLKNNINNYINDITTKNTVTSVAVQFRDLNSGPWFGINNHDLFSPSSLLKVPVMMAYYREAESNPGILNKQIIFAKSINELVPNFPPQNPLIIGRAYTVEQLIESMIIGSDNEALILLEGDIGEDRINQVSLDLSITTPQDLSMDVMDYATLFRVLYNSTYLNKEYSQKALDLLSKTEFKEGLVKLLPDNLIVSHKFGERIDTPGSHQLHDCGIVYYPKHPYLLCIMTKGPDFNDLKATIQQISSKVYSEVAKMYPK